LLGHGDQSTGRVEQIDIQERDLRNERTRRKYSWGRLTIATQTFPLP
jgi:hypothetical protein